MKQTYKVLVVDDHPGIRQALRTRLERIDAFQVVGDIGRGADSGHSDFQIVTYMLDLGVDGYILKTDSMSSVVNTIQEIAAGERRFSPGLTPILAEGNWSSKSLNLAERGVLQMLADGMSTKRIALVMHIAERTARDYVGKAIQKLRAHSWVHAIALAMRKKVIV